MKHVFTALTLAAAQLSTPPIADFGHDRRDLAVSIADLDLATEAGIATLKQRLDLAVVKACGTAYFLDAKQLQDVERCRADARKEAELALEAVVKK